MRPYRAIPIGSKDFVHGWHIELEDEHYIIPDTASICYGVTIGTSHYDFIEGFIKVIPKTVAQQVGRHDKTGKEIYEGDRVEITHWFVPTSDMYPERWLTNSPIVVELPEFYQYILNDEERDIDKENIYEIIGNIHQNPELIE